MKTRLIKWLLAGACGLLASCAIITVNVYFPEGDAKEAYKSLDGMLLKNSEVKAPESVKPPVPVQKEPDNRPRSMLIDGMHSLSFCSVAHAASNFSDDLAVELAGMPEVIKAYEEMSQRLPRLTVLFNGGAIGLTNQGLITVREAGKVTAQDERLVHAENQSRKTVVSSMARVIIKLTRQTPADAVTEQVMGKAAATYAETKREAAKTGWWIELPNGRWIQKQ